ncbi:MAG: aminotransferase class I/II-fold pyridoxal phosphate-dependent enzyme [Telluria sp.]
MNQGYPDARIPVTPVLSSRSLRGARGPHIAAITDAASVRLVTSGRIALALAARAMRLAPGDRILVPAYHSMSMIPPLQAGGVETVFYRLRPDASADLDDIAARLDDRVRALVVVNYFGFPQKLAEIRAFCDRHGIMMVEDCAHSFFGASGGQALGSFGDYAIASSMKFFPIYEGGALVSARHPLDAAALRSGGAGFELKAGLAAVERGMAFGRLPLAGALLRLPLTLKGVLWNLLKRRRGAAAAAALTPSSSDSSYGFDPAWLDKRSSLFSRMVLKLAPRRAMCEARRRNYLALAARMQALPGCRLLFPLLPDDVYPWAVPVVVDDPDALFPALKMAGVPIIRFAESLWPGVDAALCPVSAALSRQVLAFPCHQELTDAELAWMAGTIESTAAPRRAPE